MIRNQISNVNPEIDRIVQSVVMEYYEPFDHEMRNANRLPFSCPVEIQTTKSTLLLPGFSRNISSQGIALVTREAVDEGQMATIRIFRMNKSLTEIRAECRWTKPFGGGFCLAGWKFFCTPSNVRTGS